MPHDTCHATRSMPGVHRMLGVMLHVECQVCLCAREEERRLQHYALVVEHVWTLLHIVAFARHCRLVHLPTDSIPTRALYAVRRVRRSRPSFAANVLVCNLLPAPCRGFCCMVRDTRRMVSHTLRLLVPIRAVRCILRRGPFVRLSLTASRSILAFVEKPWTKIPSAQMMSPTCTAAATRARQHAASVLELL